MAICALYVGLGTSVSIHVNTLQYSLLLHKYYHIYLNLAYIIIGDAAI